MFKEFVQEGHSKRSKVILFSHAVNKSEAALAESSGQNTFEMFFL